MFTNLLELELMNKNTYNARHGWQYTVKLKGEEGDVTICVWEKRWGLEKLFG